MSGAGTPLVSVCIANYNGEHMLPDCIDSVLAQDAGVDIEIIVHDDASMDGSLALLERRYPMLQVIRSQDNVGFCIANNRMAAQARGRYILLLNNDAALHPDALRSMLDHMEAIAGPAILTLPQHDWDTGAIVDRGCLLDPFHVPAPNVDPGRSDVAYVIGACLWIPRDTWFDLGGFPEWFGSIAEDMYLCCAARLRGIPVQCVGYSGYRHRQGASFGGNRIGQEGLRTRYRRRYLSERNRLFVVAITVPSPLAWLWLFGCMSALLIEGALLGLSMFSRQPLWEIYAPAVRDFWRDIDNVTTQRRTSQQGKRINFGEFFRVFELPPYKFKMLIKHGIPRIY